MPRRYQAKGSPYSTKSLSRWQRPGSVLHDNVHDLRSTCRVSKVMHRTAEERDKQGTAKASAKELHPLRGRPDSDAMANVTGKHSLHPR